MTDVFYSNSPFGTGDLKTGGPTITTVSGVATLSVAQTGNIGQGVVIVANSINYFISSHNSSTSFNVTDNQGGVPGNISGVAVTSIHHVWASLSDAEANYLGASFLNTTDLVTNTFNPFLSCYYDHDDFTVDSAKVVISGATANDIYYLTIFTPAGGAESINNQRHNGIFDANRYLLELSDSGVTSGVVDIQDNGARIVGLQIHNTLVGDGNCDGSSSAITDIIIDKNILSVSSGGNGVYTLNGSLTMTIRNTLIYNLATQGGSSEGIYLQTCLTADIEYCTIYNFNDGIENDSGTVTVTNCIVFGNGNDLDGTFTADHNATEDGDGTNAVTLNNGIYAFSNIFTDYTNGDFSLVNNTSDTNAPQNKGTNISGITTDIIGTTRDGSTPDIGAFEFLAAGGFDAILKRYNGSSFEKSKLQYWNGSAFVTANLKYWDGSSFKTVDTTG